MVSCSRSPNELLAQKPSCAFPLKGGNHRTSLHQKHQNKVERNAIEINQKRTKFNEADRYLPLITGWSTVLMAPRG